jgi:hypothetical protein
MLVAAAAIAIAAPAAQVAAERGPTLVVPAAKTPLHVAAPLPTGTMVNPNRAWNLVESGPSGVSVPAQVIPAMTLDGAKVDRGEIVAVIPPRADAEKSRRFVLQMGPAADKPQAGFAFRELNDKSVELRYGDRPLFVYNHGVITDPKVPANDKRGSRAGYVHPLYGPDGEVLTDDFPKDHYHHHGLFWAWPHVGIDGKEFDLWMYENIQQRFVRWIAREAGPVAAVLAVENAWFVGDKKVMIERVWIRAFPPGDSRRLDIEFVLIPVDKPVTLRGAEGKSYGGLNLRYRVQNEKQTTITVPAGRTKDDLPDTPLPWADLTYPFTAKGRSGAAIFVDPSHPDFPPTWLTRHYGVLCVGWPGVKPKTFQPDVPIRLDYRVWIHRGDPRAAQVQQEFDAYGAAKQARWETP